MNKDSITKVLQQSSHYVNNMAIECRPLFLNKANEALDQDSKKNEQKVANSLNANTNSKKKKKKKSKNKISEIQPCGKLNEQKASNSKSDMLKNYVKDFPMNHEQQLSENLAHSQKGLSNYMNDYMYYQNSYGQDYSGGQEVSYYNSGNYDDYYNANNQYDEQNSRNSYYSQGQYYPDPCYYSNAHQQPQNHAY